MLRSAQVRAEFAELGFVQLRAGFAKNTVLRAGSWAQCLGLSFSGIADARVRVARLRFPRKPRVVSELNAWVRAGPRRVFSLRAV